VDDIVASGRTVRLAARLLTAAGFRSPWVVAVHAVADRETTEALERDARLELVTCNTIAHPSNRIDLSDAIRAAVERRLRADAALPAAAAAAW
jgi:ribose-phosphate pyrophosphokinase